MKNAKLLLFLVVFIDLLGFGIMIPMLPFYARHFGADAFHVGLLMFVYSGLQMFASPLWGQLSDRIGRRPVLLLTIAGQCLAFIWGGFAISYVSLFWSRVLAGFFSANISTASAYMADITTKEDRAKGMGLIGAAFGLGFIFGPAIGGLLIVHNHYGWPSLAAGALSFINLIWAAKSLPEPLKKPDSRKKFEWSAFQEVLKRQELFIPILSFFLLTFAFVQLEITFGLFLIDRFHLRERTTGFFLAGMGVIMAVIQGGVLGRLVKRHGEVKLIRVGIPLILIGLFGLSLAPSLLIVILSIVFLASGYSFTNPCLSALTSQASDEKKQGATLGIYQSASSAARVSAPLLAGYLYDKESNGAFVSGIAIVLIAGIVFTRYRRQ